MFQTAKNKIENLWASENVRATIILRFPYFTLSVSILFTRSKKRCVAVSLR